MNSSEDYLKKIVKGAGIAFLGLAISKLFGYIYRILIARVGTEEYGLFSIGIAVFSLLTTICLLGLKGGILRYVSFYKSREDYGKVKGVILFSIKTILPLSFIVGVILFIFSRQISLYIFHKEDLAVVLQILAFAIPFAAFKEIASSVFYAFQEVRYEVYSKNIVENFLKIISVFVLIILGFKVVGFAISYVFAVIFSGIMAFYFLGKKVFPLFNSTIKSIYIKKELIKFSLPLLFTTLISPLMQWIDTLMLGSFKTSSEVGIYNAALPTASLLFFVPSILLTLYVPVLTDVYAQDKKEIFFSLYKRITKWIFSTNIVLLGIFYLFSINILNALFGSDYLSGSAALLILSTGYFINYIFSTSAKVLMIFKKTNIIFLNTIVILLLNILLNFYLIPLYGINGAAMATSFSLIMESILVLVESKLIVKIFPFDMSYIKILFSSMISFISIGIIIKIWAININLFYLMFLSSAFITIYILLLIFTKSFEKEDISMLMAIKNNLFNRIKTKR